MNKRTLLLLLLFSVALAFYSQNAFADGSYACSYSGDCSDTGTSPFSGSGCYPSDLTGTYTAVCKLGVTYSCSYCSNGCSSGVCNPTPAPTPTPACIPSCTGDQCGQNNGCGGSCPSTDASTPGKCGNPATPKDPCAGVTCSTPPAATCSGSNRVTYSSSGTCSNGACSYSSSSTYCAYGCSAGACNPEPAASKPLAQPATSVCGNGATESGEECDDGLSTTSGTRYCSTGIVSYDACINCKSQPAPECQTPKCTPNEEVSRSCSGCKTTTLTMCNSDGTATYQLPNQYASECTSGCPTQAPQTCIDNDKDGYWQRTSTCTAGTDCNDNNAAINLGVTEPSCDSDTIDNDCKNGDAPACSTETVAACTPSAWSCTLPTECPSTGFKTSTCTLIDTTCTNPEAAKPATTTQSCTPPPQCGSENEKCCTANTCNTGLNCIENKVGYTIISAVCKKTVQQTVPACIDNDGDGYGSNCAKGTDCNDNNPAINPAASEPACDSDNIDNNCDGLDAPACTTTTPTSSPTIPSQSCGDNTCNGPETTASCPTDCKELKTDIAVTGLTLPTSYPGIIIPKVIKNVNEVVDFEFTVLNAGDTTVSHYSYNFFYGNGAAGGGFSNVEIPPKKSTTNGFSYAYTQTGWFSFSVNAITQGDSNTANNRLAAEIYVVNPDENNVIKKDGYFVLGNTYLMQYVGADALTTNNPSATAKFKNVATGEILQVAGGSLQGSIKIGVATYIYTPKSEPKYADYDILVDLNGDGGFGEVAGVTCTDSDKSDKSPDGKNIFVKGTAANDTIVTKTDAWTVTKTDSCSEYEPTKLIEAWCEENAVRESLQDCPAGYACGDGACISKSKGATSEACLKLLDRVSASLDQSCGDSKYDFVADLNKDKKVDSDDLGMFGANSEDEKWCVTKQLLAESPCEPSELGVCEVPSELVCSSGDNTLYFTWGDLKASQYRIEWCPEGSEFGSKDCGFNLGANPSMAIINVLKNYKDYELRVRVEKAENCIAPGKWSETFKCQVCPSTSQREFDQNKDGIVNSKDIEACNQYVGGKANDENSKCDFNGDCRIDKADLALQFGSIKSIEVSVSPKTGRLGTFFSIKVNGWAGAGLSYIMRSSIESTTKSSELYDDGSHGDEAANDGIYGAVVSNLEPGLYFADVKLRIGESEKLFQNAATFSVVEAEEQCTPLLKNSNSKNAIDVVFVPNNYGEDELKGVEANLLSRFANRILSVEPFKSNRNRFNFWYLRDSNSIDCSTGNSAACVSEFQKKVSSACGFYDQLFVLDKKSLVDAGAYSLGPGSRAVVVGTASNLGFSEGAVIHEFGHSFAGLADEYKSTAFSNVEAPNCDAFGCPKWCSGTSKFDEPVCYLVKSRDACEKTASTYDGKSYSCKWNEKASICDFPGDTGVNFGFDCKTGTGCYYQCGGVNGYRSSMDSIVGESKAGSFNAVSQEHIQNVIDCVYPADVDNYPSEKCLQWNFKNNDLWAEFILVFVKDKLFTYKPPVKEDAGTETGCVKVENNIRITSDTKLCKETYKSVDFDKNGLIIIDSDNVILDCNGASIEGTNAEGFGIYNNGHSNVEIRNCKISNFFYGIYSDNGNNIKIVGNDISKNRLLEGYDKWVQIGTGPENPYGGGVYLRRSANSLIEDNKLNNQQDGINLFEVTNTQVKNNDASHNSGWGIKLYKSSDNFISDNNFSYTARFCTHDRPSKQCSDAGFESPTMGCTCDTAAMLLVAGSNNNRILGNDLRHSGDGFFLNGDIVMGGPSENNYVAFNDGSFSPANAFESTFSKGNQFYKNTASGSAYGFWLGYSYGNTVQENTIKNNKEAGIAVENGEDNVITGNQFEGNGAAIRIWRPEKPIEGYKSTSKKYEITTNEIRKNDIGISIVDTTDSEIKANKLIGNKVPLYEKSVKNIVKADNEGLLI